MIKDKTSVEAPVVKAQAMTADAVVANESVKTPAVQSDATLTLAGAEQTVLQAEEVPGVVVTPQQITIGNSAVPLELEGSGDSIIYNGRVIDVIQMTQEQETNFTVDQALATYSVHTREIKLDASIVPAGGLVSISILAPPSGEKDLLGYFLTLHAYQTDGTFKCIANSTNKIVQNAFGDWMTYLFTPETTVLTGKIPLILQFRKQEFAVGNNYALASTGVGVYTVCIQESIGGPSSQVMVYDTTTWNNWTPVLKFETRKSENVIGHPIAIPGLIGTQDTALAVGSSHAASVELDTGTIITAKSGTLGFSESDFINNNSKYDNVIPTVKMIRLMLQNQTRLASLPAAAAAPIIPMPVATMEMPTPSDGTPGVALAAVPVAAPEAAPVAVAAVPVEETSVEAPKAKTKAKAKSSLTKTKNDRPRKRKKSD